jgi:hypothetical protein
VPLAPAALAIAALVLAITSRGDLVVLAVLLAAAGANGTHVVAIAMACAAALVRWGSSSLGAIAGAQAVLGPAGWTGDAAGVASAWLAAAALLACVPAWPMRVEQQRTRTIITVLGCAAFAVTAADVSVGPAPGGALLARVVASIVAVCLAVVITRATVGRRRERVRTLVAVLAAATAVLLAGLSG